MLQRLDGRLADWLRESYGAPTPAQAQLFAPVAEGAHALLSSPTGSGKTLAAFLPILSSLAGEPLLDRTYCVYLSPLKALVNDMARNLAEPIAGAALPIRVATRTGDTTQSERQKQARKPPHILITTPESLALLLASPKSRAHLLGVRYVVVDEIHSLAASKRGAQLALTMERLATYIGEYQRIGLSATVRPLELVAAFLGGDRPVEIVEIEPQGEPDLEVTMPIDDPLSVSLERLQEHIVDLVEKEMARSRTLLVFTNTRAGAERLARQLQERHPADEGVELALPHHGSMSKTERLDVEDRLKHARVRCVVASSSLEMGIHVPQVDRVLLVGSPKSAARTLQRMGRSGHIPGATARATLLVTDPCDLPEAHALQRLVRERRIEEIEVPRAPLDVLMQHLVAMRHELPLTATDTHALTRRAHGYRQLSREEFDAAAAEMPRVARHEYLQNAGTIPESGLLKVFHGDRYVGEIEEDFAAALREDDIFVLAGRIWRFVRSTPARILVAPARARSPAVPIWRSEGLGASANLAEETKRVLSQGSSVYPWMELQERWAGDPTEGALVESFLDVDRNGTPHRVVVFHAHLGRQANDALARAMEWRIGERTTASDWGFAILAPRSWKPTRALLLGLLAEPLEPTLREGLRLGHELLKRRFRHVASRALVIRRRDGEGIGMRQMAADRLLRWYPDEHPLVREAMEECLRGAMDVDTAERWRQSVATGQLPMRFVDQRPCGSPLAARVIAPHGDARHGALRDHADAIKLYDSMIAK